MKTNRLEAFSDGVLAIIITIMVLELKVPEGHELGDLGQSATSLLTYLLSFIYVGIYWNNHHHLFQLTSRVDGGVLWANLGLLFTLSLLPFTTAWMDESEFSLWPTHIYGVNLLLCAIAYYILTLMIYRAEGTDGHVRAAMGTDIKGRTSLVLYVVGIVAAYVNPWLSLAVYVVVAVMWMIPDRRIERYLADHPELEG